MDDYNLKMVFIGGAWVSMRGNKTFFLEIVYLLTNTTQYILVQLWIASYSYDLEEIFKNLL